MAQEQLNAATVAAFPHLQAAGQRGLALGWHRVLVLPVNKEEAVPI